MASAIAKAVKPLLPPLFHSQKIGVVVSAGKMAGAVKVRVAEHEWNKKFRKVFSPFRFPNFVLGKNMRYFLL